MKKLSIIIPTYNVASYLNECLASILPQLTDECELIIIDDASIDDTFNIVQLYKLKYNQSVIYYYKQAFNQGVSAARNLGLTLSTGEYIAFVDADDIVKHNYIISILKALKQQKDYYLLSWSIMGAKTTYFADKLPNWNCSVWSRIFKKSIIQNMFEINCSWGEDYLFLHGNINSTMSFDYIMIPIYLYRSNREGSLTQLQGQKENI